MLLVPAKARRKIKATIEEILLQVENQLQEEILMMSKRQEGMVIIKGSQGRKASEVYQENHHLPGTKDHFLVIVIFVQTLVIWQKTVEHLIEIDVIVTDNLQETILQEEIMKSYS